MAVLLDFREETFAASEEEYVYEKLEVPFLPEDGAFDPLGLADDAPDAIEERIACYNGQVLINYVASSYEQHMAVEYQKEERKAYIDHMHAERLTIVAVHSGAKEDRYHKGVQASNRFDRKAFGWRQLNTPMMQNVVGLPDGGHIAEFAFGNNVKLIKMLTKVRDVVFLPTASQVSVVVSMAHHVRPQPTGPRIRSTAPWHLALTDVFFPSPFIVDDGAEYIGQQEGAPAYVHMVVMSVNKETGDIEVKNLLENIKFSAAPKYPSSRSS